MIFKTSQIKSDGKTKFIHYWQTTLNTKQIPLYDKCLFFSFYGPKKTTKSTDFVPYTCSRYDKQIVKFGKSRYDCNILNIDKYEPS